jgi:hypothetical protein
MKYLKSMSTNVEISSVENILYQVTNRSDISLFQYQNILKCQYPDFGMRDINKFKSAPCPRINA